ncbi:MAG: hypothetical protein KF795_31185, partial [Labilithrix sp.]|nr:hypothetical protein [Labilithrix sp.]
PYKSPRVIANACTESELAALSAFYTSKMDAGEDLRISEWSAEVSGSCAQCVFDDDSGASWGPIQTQNDRLHSVNRGGCVELKSGSTACGQAFGRVFTCRLEACLPKCTSQDGFTECLADNEAIFSGPCKGAKDAVVAACGSGLNAYETACSGGAWIFERPIRAQCITGS